MQLVICKCCQKYSKLHVYGLGYFHCSSLSIQKGEPDQMGAGNTAMDVAGSAALPTKLSGNHSGCHLSLLIVKDVSISLYLYLYMNMIFFLNMIFFGMFSPWRSVNLIKKTIILISIIHGTMAVSVSHVSKHPTLCMVYFLGLYHFVKSGAGSQNRPLSEKLFINPWQMFENDL